MDVAAQLRDIEEIRQVKHRFLRCIDLKLWDQRGDTLSESATLDLGTSAFGQVAEIAPADDLFTAPLHPYSRYLISAQPSLHGPGRGMGRQKLSGEPANAIDPPSGCRFHTRCPIARKSCVEAAPPLRELRPSHKVACHFAGEFQ